MRPDRPDYATYLDELQLPADAAPFEILTASGGIRATDSIEVFQEPTIDQRAARRVASSARGVRHVRGCGGSDSQLARVTGSGWSANPDQPGRWPCALTIETLRAYASVSCPPTSSTSSYRVERRGTASKTPRSRREPELRRAAPPPAAVSAPHSHAPRRLHDRGPSTDRRVRQRRTRDPGVVRCFPVGPWAGATGSPRGRPSAPRSDGTAGPATASSRASAAAPRPRRWSPRFR